MMCCSKKQTSAAIWYGLLRIIFLFCFVWKSRRFYCFSFVVGRVVEFRVLTCVCCVHPSMSFCGGAHFASESPQLFCSPSGRGKRLVVCRGTICISAMLRDSRVRGTPHFCKRGACSWRSAMYWTGICCATSGGPIHDRDFCFSPSSRRLMEHFSLAVLVQGTHACVLCHIFLYVYISFSAKRGGGGGGGGSGALTVMLYI